MRISSNMARWQAKNKYNSHKVTVNGVDFDSRKEARRYSDLLILEKAGEILNLQRQVKFILIPTQKVRFERFSGKTGRRLKDGEKVIEKECAYYADFVYNDNKTGEKVVEDVKGYKEGQAYALFSIKRKLMLYIHGIKIKEI